MGKWCSVSLPDGFGQKEKELKALSPEHINRLWEQTGRPTLEQFNLRWYWGSSGGGWKCIDDSASTKQFKMFVPDKYSNEHWERVATLLAIRTSQ